MKTAFQQSGTKTMDNAGACVKKSVYDDEIDRDATQKKQILYPSALAHLISYTYIKIHRVAPVGMRIAIVSLLYKE